MRSADFESPGFEPCKKMETSVARKKKSSMFVFSPAFVKHTELLFSLRP